MTPITNCICDFRMERGCPVHGGGQPSLASLEHLLGLIIETQGDTMAAIDNLTAADTALKAEVTTALTDFAAAIVAANSANDPAIQSVADDMNAMVTQIQGADPAAAAAAPVTPPAAS